MWLDDLFEVALTLFIWALLAAILAMIGMLAVSFGWHVVLGNP